MSRRLSSPPARGLARALRAVLLGALSLALASCSGGSDRPTGNLELINALTQIVATNRAQRRAPPFEMTRAVLDSLDVSVIEAVVENRDQTGYLIFDRELRDGRPGTLQVWRSSDDITLTFREGVLVASRGLGGDMMSSSAPVRTGRPGPATGGERRQFYRALDNKSVPITLACDLVTLGTETIELYERRYSTRRVQERCASAGGTVVNDYWIESGSGLVRQSRQWAGPVIGYLTLRTLLVF